VKIKRTLLLLAAAALAACEGSSYWSGRLRANTLYQRTNALKISGPCAALVPLEYEYTFPVPLDPSEKTLEVLFYAQTPERYAPRYEIVTPQYAAVFNLDTTSEDRCFALHPERLDELGPATPPPYFKTAYARRTFQTYDSLQKTCALYFGRQALEPKDRKILGEFADSFQKVAEPVLLPRYYRINPDFWEWLRREGGRSIPKPA
jgi:hypothetical protein